MTAKRQKPLRLTYDDLPQGLSRRSQNVQGRHLQFGYLSRTLIDDLVAFLDGRNVLEIFAGRGQLSALLQEQGVSVVPTSLRMAYDGSEKLGHVIDVDDLEASKAILQYRDWMDVLLVCWPEANEALCRAVRHLPPHALIVYLGEISSHATIPPFLGGCASDAFFESVEEVPELTAKLRYPTFRQDQIKVYRQRHLLSGL